MTMMLTQESWDDLRRKRVSALLGIHDLRDEMYFNWLVSRTNQIFRIICPRKKNIRNIAREMIDNIRKIPVNFPASASS